MAVILSVLGVLKDFHLVFVPLFVAMDPLSIVPFLLVLLEPIEPTHRKRVIHVALLTALMVGLVFLGLGRGILFILGIRVAHFLIAGGIALVGISLRDLLAPAPQTPHAPDELMAVVPIGTPLLVGPSTISLLILLTEFYPTGLVVSAFLANVLVAWVVFRYAQGVANFLGKGGLLAFSKVAYLLLIAIAVKLISQGIIDIVTEVQ